MYFRSATLVALIAAFLLSAAVPAYARDVLVDTRYVQHIAMNVTAPNAGSFSHMFSIPSTSWVSLSPLWEEVPLGRAQLILSTQRLSSTYGPTRTPFQVNDPSIPVTQDWVADNFDLLSGLSANYDVIVWVK